MLAFKEKQYIFAAILLAVLLITYYYSNKIFDAHKIKNSEGIKIFNEEKEIPVIKEGCQNFDNKTSNLLNTLLTHSDTLSKEDRESLGPKDLAVVSFSSLNHMNEAIRSCDSFQQNPSLNGIPFIMYLDNDVTQNIKDMYTKLCPIAKIIPLNLSEYPKYVQDLSQYRFKAICLASTLKKYKDVLYFDTSIRFNKYFNLSDLVSDVIKNNPIDVTLLSPNGHNMFSVTHPKMFECFPSINKTETQIHEQFRGGLTLWIGSESGWKIMKRFATCAFNPECMGPTNSTANCDASKIFRDPYSFSGCHRYDQSAINLILLEYSNYHPSIFQRESYAFIVQRDSKLK